MLKKALSFLLVLALVFSFCGAAMADEEKTRTDHDAPLYWKWVDMDTGESFFIDLLMNGSLNHIYTWADHLRSFDHSEEDPNNPHLLIFYGHGLYDFPSTWIWFDWHTAKRFVIHDSNHTHRWGEHLRGLQKIDVVGEHENGYVVFYGYELYNIHIPIVVQEEYPAVK